MFPINVEAFRHHLQAALKWTCAVALIMCACPMLPAQAQNTTNSFSSGSTGADGAFAPTANQTIVVPESGVFNYTTVSIPSGVVITYIRNARNVPVKILASGDVSIAGSIFIDGKPGNLNGGGGAGGPGGYDGGSAGYGAGNSFVGSTGVGPGGGIGGGSASGNNVGGGGGAGFSSTGASGTGANASAVVGPGGPRYSTPALSPLVGGSGGGGGGAVVNKNGGPGGGGGGAILIASSTSITLVNTGAIYARGGAGGNASTGGYYGYEGGAGGGGGSGGAIRFIANTVSGTGRLEVTGGNRGTGSHPSCCSGYIYGGNGAPGYARVEAFDYSNFNPNANPTFVSFALPHPVSPANTPQLRITSVAGVGAPANPLGSLHGIPDIVVPAAQPNPVDVAIEGVNLPVGTVVQVTLTPAAGVRATYQSAQLAGTEAASTATASVTLTSGMSVITANAVIDLTQPTPVGSVRQPVTIDGERVDRIEVAATFGGASEVTYVTHSGRRIKKASE
ncbi:MAG TPA: hypothetical protein VM870_09135 [Pyrinomonadaceae bacterium]|nr:hypothetical protein [Pyrinomonadaceae bacterium]